MYIQECVIKNVRKLIPKYKEVEEKEMLYHINRYLDLGKKVYKFKDGCYLIQYYDLCFKIENFRCVKVYRDVFNKKFIVSKEDKIAYEMDLIYEQYLA